MNKERIEQLLVTRDVVACLTLCELTLDEITGLIAKAKPNWEKIFKRLTCSTNTAYAGQIVLSSADIKLDVIITEFSEPGKGYIGYAPVRWQILVAEEREIRANMTNYRPTSEKFAPIKDLFEQVQKEYDERTLLEQPTPSQSRTKLAVQKYLAE